MPYLGPLIDKLPWMYDCENVQIIENEWQYLNAIHVLKYYKGQDCGIFQALFKQFDLFPFKKPMYLCSTDLPVSNADDESVF